MAIILDLETAAIHDAAAYVKPAGNLKDPEKIKASIEERAAKAAVNPWLCEVKAIGWCWAGEDIERVEVARNEPQEVSLLKDLWHLIQSEQGTVPIVTFNGLGFDLPVLMARSMLLGVKHVPLNIDRFRSPHPDLMLKLCWGDVSRAHGLQFYCQRFGISTEDKFSGAMIGQLIADGDWESVKLHCASDVRLTRLLAERIGLLKAPQRVAA